MKKILMALMMGVWLSLSATVNIDFNAPAVGTPSTISETWEQIRTNEAYILQMDTSKTVSNLPVGAMGFDKSLNMLCQWDGSSWAYYQPMSGWSSVFGSSEISLKDLAQEYDDAASFINFYGKYNTKYARIYTYADETIHIDCLKNTGLSRTKGIYLKPYIGGMTWINSSKTDTDTRISGDNVEDLLYVDASTDRVGIGTASPSRLLSIVSAGDAQTVLKAGSASNNSELYFGDNSTDYAGAIGYTHSTDSMAFHTAGAQRMTILSDGKVGIGTTSPSTYLEVLADTAYASTYGGILIASSHTAGDPALILGADNTANIVYIQGKRYNSGFTQNIALQPNAGNVGIGTASPTRLLSVVAPVTAQMVLSGGTTGSSDLYFGDNSTDYAGAIGYTHSTDSMTFHTAGAQRMTILSDGKVGIGTTSPSELLDVNGTIECIALVETSDECLKTNIIDITGKSTEKIMQLRPVKWDWKDKTFGNKTGFVAQELEQVIPEAVVIHSEKTYQKNINTNETEIVTIPEKKGVVPSVILTHLVKAFQEQQQEIQELRQAVSALERRLPKENK